MLHLKKVEIKNKSVDVVVSVEVESAVNKQATARNAVLKLVLGGNASPNHINQMIDGKLSGLEFEEVLVCQNKIKELIKELMVTIGFDDNTHKGNCPTKYTFK